MPPKHIFLTLLDFSLESIGPRLASDRLVLVPFHPQATQQDKLAAREAYEVRRNHRQQLLKLLQTRFLPLFKLLRSKQMQGERTPLRSIVAACLGELHPDFFTIVGVKGWKDYAAEAERIGLVNLHPPIGGKGGRGATIEALMASISEIRSTGVSVLFATSPA